MTIIIKNVVNTKASIQDLGSGKMSWLGDLNEG